MICVINCDLSHKPRAKNVQKDELIVEIHKLHKNRNKWCIIKAIKEQKLCFK